MEIRDERPDDHAAVRQLTLDAFPGDDEARLIDMLRADGDVALSLVAEDEGAIVGHVMLSPMNSPAHALGLGPISVTPARQRTGVGSALMREAITRSRDAGWKSVFLLGDFRYYCRFGFDLALADRFESKYRGPDWAALELVEGGLPVNGRADYADAFENL